MTSGSGCERGIERGFAIEHPLYGSHWPPAATPLFLIA